MSEFELGREGEAWSRSRSVVRHLLRACHGPSIAGLLANSSPRVPSTRKRRQALLASVEIDADEQPGAFASGSLDHTVERIACLDVETCVASASPLLRQFRRSSGCEDFSYDASSKCMTAGIVLTRMRRSFQIDQHRTYSASSATRSAYLSELLPLTCQAPVRPGLA